MKRTRVIGTGSYLPKRVLSNEDIAGGLGLSPEQIFRLTGIRTRHHAASDEASSHLAVQASRRALEAAGCPASALDAIIVSTTSPDMVFPSTACLVQQALGCGAVAAFDVSASCSGFLYGLSMAHAMIQSGQARTCLVAAAEAKLRFIDPQDSNTAMLFGDGAGAVVVRGEPELGPDWPGILGVRLHADGARHDLIRVPAGGSRAPMSRDTVARGEHTLRMNGSAVFRVAVRRIEQAVQDLVKEFGVRIEDVAHVVLHQANGRILEQVAERLGLSHDRLVSVLEHNGNTSSASLPIALDAAVRGGTVVPGQLLLLGSFGGGATWATALVRW